MYFALNNYIIVGINKIKVFILLVEQNSNAHKIHTLEFRQRSKNLYCVRSMANENTLRNVARHQIVGINILILYSILYL